MDAAKTHTLYCVAVNVTFGLIIAEVKFSANVFIMITDNNINHGPEAFSYSLNFFLVTGHSGRVVTLSPPTSEAGVRFPARPQVGKLVVACRWSAVYSNPDELYVLVSSALPTTPRDMTCTVLKAT